MKKVVFMALATVFMLSSGFGVDDLSNFSTEEELSLDHEDISTRIEFELLGEGLIDGMVPCRRRTCTYVNGELQGCTEWEYGECDKDGDGNLSNFRGISLEPVIIGG